MELNLKSTLSELDKMSNVVSSGNEAVAPRTEKARLGYDKEGVCPYCQTAMVRSFAAGQPVHICHADRYVAPMSNEVLAQVEAEMQRNGGVPDFTFSA
jgi:hypothetical protein